VKLIASHVADGHGTIEWMFGCKDVDVFKTGKRDVPGLTGFRRRFQHCHRYATREG
jgi:hypothetical protein